MPLFYTQLEVLLFILNDAKSSGGRASLWDVHACVIHWNTKVVSNSRWTV